MADIVYPCGYSVKQSPDRADRQSSGKIWYVARVRIGAEENVRRRCMEQISSEILKNCYVFRYREKRRVRGEWIVQESVLFPGYVFLEFGKAETGKIGRELWCIQEAIGILDTNGGLDVLTNEEVDFLEAIGGCGQLVELSEGVIEGSKVRVYLGPLVGKEKYIKKIDRHKRKAFLELPIFGEKQRMQVGLEIVAKI